MIIRDLLSVPLFLVLLLLAYAAMWMYIAGKKINKKE